MQKYLRYTYNVIRLLIVTILVTGVSLYALMYVLLCIPAVQNKIKTIGEEELSKFLKTEVKIGQLSIKPFNQIMLYDVQVLDQKNSDLLRIEELGAGINIEKLLSERRIEINYAELIGLHGTITKANPNSDTNLQFIIDAFKPKGNKPPKRFDLAIRNIVIRNSDVRYDVLSLPRKDHSFDKNHLRVTNLCADIDLPRLKNDDFLIDVKRMSFGEQSGFEVKQISTHIAIAPHSATISDLHIALENSIIDLNQQTFSYDSVKHIGNAIQQTPLNIRLKNAKINLSDFKAFVPAFSNFPNTFTLSCVVNGDKKKLTISQLELKDTAGDLNLSTKGVFTNIDDKNRFTFSVPRLDLSIKGKEINKITHHFAKLDPNVNSILRQLGDLKLDAAISGASHVLDFDGKIASSPGNVQLKAMVKKTGQLLEIVSDINTQHFDVGRLISRSDLIGALSANVKLNTRINGKQVDHALVKGDIAYIDFKGYRYSNIAADVEGSKDNYKGSVSINDPNGEVRASGNVAFSGKNSKFDVEIFANRVDLHAFNLYHGNPRMVSFTLNAAMEGNKIDNLNGYASLNHIKLTNADGKAYEFDSFTLNADNESSPQVVRFDSDFIHGELFGTFDFKTLVPAVKDMVAQVLPTLFVPSGVNSIQRSNNDFTFNLTVEPNEKMDNLLKLPVKLLYKATIDGKVNMREKDITLNVNIPYIQQGKNLVEGTSLMAYYDSTSNSFIANAKTLLPSKTGKIAVLFNANASNGRIDTDLGWKYNRPRDFHGNILTSYVLTKSEDKTMQVHADVNPSIIVVNDTVWNVNRGAVDYQNGVVKIEGVHAFQNDQYIDISGVASHQSDDAIVLKLQNIDLDYVFETLNINNVNFGGRATGVFYAKDLFSKSPKLLTENLHVENLKYNYANMGNADIESHWDNEQKGIAINAVLSQQNGLKSYVSGAIFPTVDSLYFDFKANKANVKFMKPFMSAFTSDIDGYASGHAVLFGNFKTIDLYGDIFAEDLKLKLDFSNVYYYCTDSIHMEPGLIEFSDVTIKDHDGHSGKLSGWVKHQQFHYPSFNFSVTNAKNLLCYDTNANINPIWYGTIYGDGSAFIDGEPGFVNIKVNMESAPGSKFTFVMSDNQVATDYKFITYRDRDKLNGKTKVEAVEDTIPEVVKQFKQKIKKAEESNPTKYLIDLQGSITPDMQMTLVMDPIGGDKIKATGNGNLQMKYDNTDERLEMYGKYTLEKGTYNFTLQDIIVKDFTIKNGSSISFDGDPYSASMDIEAIYSLNANIRDLDESFAADRELNRTSVPVHALLKASGVISQPDISFDLEFPTLTAEAYRKIKSIISTDDMMNRQIIYLLALNRFYTPDYMNGTYSGNEWTSFASSTISSQLSSLLGQLNDNWTIAPNFRTNKGDFTDTEFDLALSSQLLNNRLRFNGNFGYRDNTYNTKNSNFIGDFDIEYLLNSKGTWLLKAYNHFNDQNLYSRTAMTTQGVGIVFKHDFNNLFDFLRKKKSKQVVDTLKVEPIVEDSLQAP